jgi:hypothetical protein
MNGDLIPHLVQLPLRFSSSSSTKLAAASGDSEMASFNSRPKRLEAPAIAILYTGILQSNRKFTENGNGISKEIAVNPATKSISSSFGLFLRDCGRLVGLRRRRDHP